MQLEMRRTCRSLTASLQTRFTLAKARAMPEAALSQELFEPLAVCASEVCEPPATREQVDEEGELGGGVWQTCATVQDWHHRPPTGEGRGEDEGCAAARLGWSSGRRSSDRGGECTPPFLRLKAGPGICLAGCGKKHVAWKQTCRKRSSPGVLC